MKQTKAAVLAQLEQVYKALCQRYGVPTEPIIYSSYNRRHIFDYTATQGYRVDELVKYLEGYKKRLNDPIEPATEKQLKLINKLSDTQDKEALQGATLNKVSASYAITILLEAEKAVFNRYSTAADFEAYVSELKKLSTLTSL